jgi:hypothetical protein
MPLSPLSDFVKFNIKLFDLRKKFYYNNNHEEKEKN